MDSKIVILAVLLLVTVAGPGCISQPDRPQSESSQDNMSGENIENIKDIEGMWLGSLEVQGGNKLRILFNISASPEGSINATMDSLDQGANGIPVEIVTYKDGDLRLEVKSVKGVFEGTLKERAS